MPSITTNVLVPHTLYAVQKHCLTNKYYIIKMSRKNFKVDTANNGQTPKQDKAHQFTVEKKVTPVDKEKVEKDRENRRKAREEQYKTFRVNALKRRAKRMGLTEEQTKEKVDQLLKQLEEPATYNILVTYHISDKNLLVQALKKEDIVWKIMVDPNRRSHDAYCIIEADIDVLDYLRGLNIPTMKIYPHVKRKPSVIPATESKPKSTYVAKNTDKSKTPKGIRNAKRAKVVAAMYEELKKRKEKYPNYKITSVKIRTIYNTMHNDHKLAADIQKNITKRCARKLKKQEMLTKKRIEKRRTEALKKRRLAASKIKVGTTVPLKANKPSTASKKASTALKQAA